MPRSILVLAVLVSRVCSAQTPAYTAADIVNASDYSPGPFAPNSVLSIFGSNLSWYTAAFGQSQPVDSVPTYLGGVEVYVGSAPAPLLYVSSTQINFLIPATASPGTVAVRVVRESDTGPTVTVTLTNGAPALFDDGTGFAIATHLDGTLLNDASPAQPGEVIVVYATGLGRTNPNPEPGEIPTGAATIQMLSTLTISLEGVPLPSGFIYYAGATPNFAGLYQLNIQIPPDVSADPVIQVSIGAQATSGSLKIAVQ